MNAEPDPPSFPCIQFAENLNISPHLVPEYTRHAFCSERHCKRFAFCPYSASCCNRCRQGRHSVPCDRRQNFIQWHQITPVMVKRMDGRLRPQGYVRMHTLPSDKCTTAECSRVANMEYGNCCGLCTQHRGHTRECNERQDLILSMCFPTLALVCFKTFEWRLRVARSGHNQESWPFESSDDSEPEAESWTVLDSEAFLFHPQH